MRTFPDSHNGIGRRHISPITEVQRKSLWFRNYFETSPGTFAVIQPDFSTRAPAEARPSGASSAHSRRVDKGMRIDNLIRIIQINMRTSGEVKKPHITQTGAPTLTDSFSR